LAGEVLPGCLIILPNLRYPAACCPWRQPCRHRIWREGRCPAEKRGNRLWTLR